MCIILKETKESDIPLIIAAERDPSNSPYIDQWDFSRHRDSLMENDIRHMVIFNNCENLPVGYTIMAGLSLNHKSAELKRLVITDKGKGYGSEAINLIKSMVFEDLDFHRLWLDVRDHNHGALSLYKKLGFTVEGHLRECVYVEDHYESIYIMGILRHEYFSG